MLFSVFYRQRGDDELTGKIHSHINDFEIIHITRGEGTVIFGDREYRFSEGDVFAFDGTLPHYILPRTKGKYERSKLILSKSLLAFLDLRLPSLTHHRAGERLDALFAELFAARDDRLRALFLLFELLYICQSQPSAPQRAKASAIDGVLRYIHEHLEEPLSIDAIASQSHLSKFHLCRVFKEKTGTTIGAYIRSQRIYRAKTLLFETDKPISEIALEVGYNDVSHFIKAFREETSLTPSRYRHSL